jgi:hypothetical protein
VTIRRKHGRDCAGRRVSGAQGRQHNQDRHADKGTGDAPQHCPEKYRKQNHERGDRDRRSRYARLDIAADDELDDVEADEHHDRRRERLVLSGGKKCRQDCSYERSDERDKVQDKGDDAPFTAEIETIDRGESPKAEPGQEAHAEAHKRVRLQSSRDFRCGVDRDGAKSAASEFAEPAP